MGGTITKLSLEDHGQMHFSLSPSSKSKRKRAEREVEGRLASFPLWNGRSRRRGPPDATPEGASEGNKPSALGAANGDAVAHHPFVIECLHPLNRLVHRFVTSDNI